MTNTSHRKICFDCQSEPAVVQCQGCAEYFCWQHTLSHREKILQQFAEIDSKFRHVEQIFQENQFVRLDGIDEIHDEIAAKIDQWEQTSIDKIRQLAAEKRIQLKQLTRERWNYLKIHLNQIDDELKSTRERNNVLETDMKQWTNRLNELKQQLISKPKLIFKSQSNSFVERIDLFDMNSSEVFERATDNVQFNYDNRVVSIGSGSDIYSEVRGMKQYRTGQHLIRLQVEKLQGWILFGIINAAEPLQIHSYMSPSCYGWYNGEGFVYRAGQGCNEHGHGIIENDIAQLIIDCDQRLIRLINERTNEQLELQVDLQSCPFPWQLHLNLNMTPTRIRILSSSI